MYFASFVVSMASGSIGGRVFNLKLLGFWSHPYQTEQPIHGIWSTSDSVRARRVIQSSDFLNFCPTTQIWRYFSLNNIKIKIHEKIWRECPWMVHPISYFFLYWFFSYLAITFTQVLAMFVFTIPLIGSRLIMQAGVIAQPWTSQSSMAYSWVVQLSTIAILCNTFNSKGFARATIGYHPPLWQGSPYVALTFWSHNVLQKTIIRRDEIPQLSIRYTFICWIFWNSNSYNC